MRRGREKSALRRALDAQKEIEARERGRKRYEEEEKLKVYVEQHPEYMLVRRDGRLTVVQRPQPEAAKPVGTAASACPEQSRSGGAGERQLAKAAEFPSSEQQKATVLTQPEKEPVASTNSAAEVRERIVGMIRKNLPELTNAYNEALKREAEKQSMKKEPQKETRSTDVEKKAT